MDIQQEIQLQLNNIEKTHNVTILHAVESGSRAWGFPSPDSDFDVRFIYAHSKDWYIQLQEKRDVIELPINEELDISGWDLRKALNLTNKGNAVVQEWLISPIVYQTHPSTKQLQTLADNAFNPIATFHHYLSTAKNAYSDINTGQQIKLKRFFYFARAVLSALWIAQKHTMPSIVFAELLDDLPIEDSVREKVTVLITTKATAVESTVITIDNSIIDFFNSVYESLLDVHPIANDNKRAATDTDFLNLLNENFL